MESVSHSAGSVVYETTLSDAHVVESWRRARRCKRGTGFMRGFRVFASLLLAVLVGLVFYTGGAQRWPLGLVVTAFFLLVTFSEQIDQRLVVRRWRKSHFRNTLVHAEITAEGKRSTGEFGEGLTRWTAFTSCRRFKDGFLLFAGSSLAFWLSDACLVVGTPEDAAQLFRAHVKDYKDV